MAGDSNKLSPRCLPGPEHHLRTAKQRDPGAAALERDTRIPDLRRAPQMDWRREAQDGAVARGAEEVRLQLDLREAACACRQQRDAAVAAARVGQRDHRGGVQVAVRRHHFLSHRHPARDGLGRDCENFHTDQPRQMAFAETIEVLRRCSSHAGLLYRISTLDGRLPGEPGIGKTHFARKIAQLLGTGFGFVPMSSLTAGWVLSGASSQWKNAKPGKVFDTFLNGDYANPVIVVDELDKASSDGQYDPLGALYELLEVETSTRFVDEFVELPIDASGALWLATANDAARIPDPLLNRLSIYEIEAPDAAGSARIAATIYREIRSTHDWGRQFPASLSPLALEKLASLPPREMRRVVHAAFGNAKLAGRGEIGPDDLQDARGARKTRIGF